MRDAKLIKKPANARNKPEKLVQITSLVNSQVASSEKLKSIDPPNREKPLKSKRKCCEKINEHDDIGSDEDGFIEIGDRSKPPKRHDPSKWKRNVQAKIKRETYEMQSSFSVPKCVHLRGHFKCNEVRTEDVAFLRHIFAKRTTTHDQNQFMLTQLVVEPVKRHRPRNDSKAKKSVSPSYFLRLKSAKRIRVCKVAFGKVLGVGLDRLTDLVKFYNKTGEAKPEMRGGDHKVKKYGPKRTSVIEFIKKLKARESHYGRNKSCKLYLPHELKSIKNLCGIYNSNQEPSNEVTYPFFKKIFRNNFNLAFGTPRTDVCSFCLRYKHLLRIESDPSKKQLLRSQLRVHKLRSKSFYKLLKERKPHIKTMAGDCQQNQCLPKIPDQLSYFSRQLNLYNFTMAENIDKDATLNFAYTWTEDQSRKGSNQIASAVFHKLMNTNFEGIAIPRLFFDGCGGQNKNVQMLCMASFWLVNKAPKSVKEMEIVFPVTGHSFLPPDRVFGRIEKDIRKEEEILSPAEYHKIIGTHETVLQLGKSWKVFDWKKYTVERFKSAAALPFKISQTKIFKIRKSTIDSKAVEIKAEKNYRNSDAEYQSVCKKGSNFHFYFHFSIYSLLKEMLYFPGMNLTSSPELVKEKPVINDAKLGDVYSLLQNRFGVNWRKEQKLSYFKSFFKSNYKPIKQEKKENDDCEESDQCSCCEEDEVTFLL